MRLTCPGCLDGTHRCSVYTPAHWEGGGDYCACRCRRERLRAIAKATPRQKPGPKPRPREPKAPKLRPAAKPRKWTDAKIRELCDLERQGMSSRQIGEAVGSHMTVVRTYLKIARQKGWR